MVIDSNIIIYSVRPEYPELKRIIAGMGPGFSALSYVEVLGYHRLTPDAAAELEAFFADATVFPVTDAVLDRAIGLRQTRSMSLGDAIVAATALLHGGTLVTRNVADFDWIPGLTVINPIDG